MNLSKIKTVGFIINFNPKGSYPELAYPKAKEPVKATIPVKEAKIPKAGTFALKRAKAAYKKAVGVGYKPKTIVRSSIV